MSTNHFQDESHFKHGINLWTGEPNKPVFYTKEMALKLRDIKKPAPDLKMDIVKYANENEQLYVSFKNLQKTLNDNKFSSLLSNIIVDQILSTPSYKYEEHK